MTAPPGGRYMPFKTQDANISTGHKPSVFYRLYFIYRTFKSQLQSWRERCSFSLVRAVKPVSRSYKIMSYIPVCKTPRTPHKLKLAGISHLGKYEYEFSWSISLVPFCFTILSSLLSPNSFPLGKVIKLNPGVCFTHHLQLVNGFLNVTMWGITLDGGTVSAFHFTDGKKNDSSAAVLLGIESSCLLFFGFFLFVFEQISKNIVWP